MLSKRLSFKVDSPQYSRRFAICIIIILNYPPPLTMICSQLWLWKQNIFSILVHSAGVCRFASLTAYIALVKLIQH